VAPRYQFLEQFVVLGVSGIAGLLNEGGFGTLPTLLGRAVIWGVARPIGRSFLKKIKLVIGLTDRRATRLIVGLLNRGR